MEPHIGWLWSVIPSFFLFIFIPPSSPLHFQLYHHGEKISVNVHIQNNSNKAVKKIKVSVRQFADICLFSTAQYKCTVADIESE